MYEEGKDVEDFEVRVELNSNNDLKGRFNCQFHLPQSIRNNKATVLRSKRETWGIKQSNQRS